MNFDEPKFLKVICMSQYEYIQYESDDGRVFLQLDHESGFGSYSEVIQLTPDECQNLSVIQSKYINELRSTFSHETKRFRFHGNKRNVQGFNKWPAVKVAIDNWHGRKCC